MISVESLVAKFIAKGILQVSPVGSVWRVKKKIGGRAHRLIDINPVRAEKEMPNGRLQIQVYVDGKRFVCASHRLIWYLYNGEIPGKHHIHHKNEDRKDNRISNLECLTVGDHVRLHAKDRTAWNKGKGGTEKVKQWHRKTVNVRRKNSAKDASKCTTYGKMDDHQKNWLSRLALANVESIIDCNITDSTVKMLINGEIHTRRVTQRYSRIMGYHRPLSSWNIGKQQEHADRLNFEESKA